jgi:hypothetical protein
MSKLPHFKFRLYVAGDGPHSVQAIANLNALCREYLTERHEIEIADVLHEPQRALGRQSDAGAYAGKAFAHTGPKDRRQPRPARRGLVTIAQRSGTETAGYFWQRKECFLPSSQTTLGSRGIRR